MRRVRSGELQVPGIDLRITWWCHKLTKYGDLKDKMKYTDMNDIMQTNGILALFSCHYRIWANYQVN